jgi:hypothetical protein
MFQEDIDSTRPRGPVPAADALQPNHASKYVWLADRRSRDRLRSLSLLSRPLVSNELNPFNGGKVGNDDGMEELRGQV